MNASPLASIAMKPCQQGDDGPSLRRVAASQLRNSAVGNSTVTKPTSVDTVADRSFIDTNVLVYAEASDAPDKQQAALALLKQLYETATGVPSEGLNGFQGCVALR